MVIAPKGKPRREENATPEITISPQNPNAVRTCVAGKSGTIRARGDERKILRVAPAKALIRPTVTIAYKTTKSGSSAGNTNIAGQSRRNAIIAHTVA
jgi:hypothetical protein